MQVFVVELQASNESELVLRWHSSEATAPVYGRAH